MNLKQMEYKADHDYDIQTKLHKRIAALTARCAQLELKLMEQKEKPPGSGNNSPVFYNTTMDLVKSVKSNKSYYQGGPRDVY